MESKTFKLDLEFSSIGTPSESLKEYYAKLYRRNQTKFIRRSKLELEHLGSEFEYGGNTYKIIGSMDSILMVIMNVNDNKYYKVHSDIPTNRILNNK